MALADGDIENDDVLRFSIAGWDNIYICLPIYSGEVIPWRNNENEQKRQLWVSCQGEESTNGVADADLFVRNFDLPQSHVDEQGPNVINLVQFPHSQTHPVNFFYYPLRFNLDTAGTYDHENCLLSFDIDQRNDDTTVEDLKQTGITWRHHLGDTFDLYAPNRPVSSWQLKALSKYINAICETTVDNQTIPLIGANDRSVI